MRLRSFLTCVAVAPWLMAANQPPLRLQPSSQWVLDYAQNSCRLVRNFGTGKDATKLGFESTAPGETEMMVIGKPLDTDQDEISARFLPVGGKPFRGRLRHTADSHEPGGIFDRPHLVSDEWFEKHELELKSRGVRRGVRPPPDDPAERANGHAARLAFAAAATELEVDTGRRRPIILETGSLGDAIKSFDECSRDSLRDWGVDPDLEDKIVRPVWAADPGKWFGPEDYPPELVRAGAESEIDVRLLVDASGRVTKCTSLTHFDEPKFEKIVCDKFMQRASFQPAELADGTKVPSYYINRVIFRIGRRFP